MTSQGQRFRRRALRRGYKVDEVDLFLDRVEATLNGNARGGAVTATEVHDVVFRVRFGGYDEWQVDLHLDRVERQLAEMAERGPIVPPVGAPPERRAVTSGERPGARPPAGDRYGAPDDRFGGDPRFPQEDRYARRGDERATGTLPPVRDDRSGPPVRPAGPPAPAGAGFGPGYSDSRFDDLRGDGARYDEPRRYEEPPPARRPEPTPPPRFEDAPTVGGRGGYPGFEPGRHGKMDMTTEIRMPADISAPAAPQLGGDAGRVDQLRRTFQPRRFGSGYDPVQVDRLFEGIVNAMAGRSGGQITDADLDPGQFNLVPGGYFEAEVDQALREVRDLIRNRR
jgi:DivIVA domain-containing protein